MFATLKGLLIKFFLGIIILSFVIWGIGDIIKSINSDYVAKIGNKIITIEEFRGQVLKEKEHLHKTFGNELSDKQLKQLGFDKYIINKMIQKILLVKAAQDLGFKLSETKIAELIKRDENFHDKEGNFDRVQFEHFLKYNHLNERELSNKLNEQYIVKILVDLLQSYQFEIKDYEKTLAQYYSHKRKAEIIKINLEELKTVAPSEDELKKFYDENNNLFMLTERRDFKVAILDPKKVESEIKISDDEVKQAYEDRGYDNDKKSLNEMYKTLHHKLVVQKLENNIELIRNEIEDLIAGGVNLADIAQKFKLKLETYHTLSMEDIQAKSLNEALAKAFEIGLDDPKQIFFDPAANCYWIIELSQIITPKVKEFSAVRDKAKSLLIAKNKKDLVQQIKTELLEEYSKDKAFKATLLKYNLNAQNLTIGRDGLELPANIPAGLVDELFAVGKGEFANLNSVDQKNFYIGLVTEIIIDPTQPDSAYLQKVKGQLSQSYKNELIEQYVEYLRNHYKVKINYNLIDHLFN